MRVYKGTLTLIGPVFIGSDTKSEKLEKKEYIFNFKNKKVIIPKLDKMYYFLQKNDLAEEYENFMLNEKKDLGYWLKEHKIKNEDINKWTKYELDCGDAIFENKNKSMQIIPFIKDAYGKPYIPGSSIKGMLRTILLCYDILNNKNKEEYINLIQSSKFATGKKVKRKNYLTRETKKIEQQVFNKANRSKKIGDMTNDILGGLIISDSDPLSVSDLVLCQKLEYHIDGKIKSLNLLRECIKPKTKVNFTITIDESICPYTKEYINEAILAFSNLVNSLFIEKFNKIEQYPSPTVWLGGGAGYLSKTITYAMYEEEGVKIVKNIFDNTGVPRNHNHHLDLRLGVSPHILKMTKYEGKQYQFGQCTLQLEEKNITLKD